jgi:carbonic anhydrase/acetyltransferase-like protein (isoleucine patch superfamily)
MYGFEHPVRPNTPVLPFVSPSSTATFIDPSVRIVAGQQITIGSQSYLAPYANLDAQGGLIKFGRFSTLQDNATLVANPNGAAGLPEIQVGDLVAIAYGATIAGPSQVGGYEDAAALTYVGPNAVVDGATISPGAFVSARAYVGPGVTLPAGLKVLPGAVVTTQAEAADPALGKVAPVTAADLSALNTTILDSIALASGYTTLYQGVSSTGASPATTTSGIFNGNLAAVSGISAEPGRTAVSFEPPQTSPKFPNARGKLIASTIPNFRARVIGGVVVHQRTSDFALGLGRSDSIRGDVGQPIEIGTLGRLGNFVSIHAPRNGKLTIGQNFRAGDHAVILGGTRAVIGDNVEIGAGSVVENSTIGSGAVVGERSILLNATIPAGAVIPAGSIIMG